VSNQAVPYRGRFAPSPTGPLHAGSLVAALASWLDARANGGSWIVRIEDVDTPRCSPQAAETILQQLAACGLVSDEPVVWQSQRTAHYEAALAQLQASGQAYRCRCTRADVERALAALGRTPQRHGERPYPGTCRHLQVPAQERSGWRVRSDQDGADVVIDWFDHTLGPQQQNLTQAVGDFVLKRSDGLWAYQLAVVVDDADQGITHIVRGQDLADNTPRQIHLQRLLGLPSPAYRHTPLVLASDGQKLSKQNGAEALQVQQPLLALREAAAVLGLRVAAQAKTVALADWLPLAAAEWRQRVAVTG
jgi:glutamyl-Q tRNA(Asp) synthetase